MLPQLEVCDRSLSVSVCVGLCLYYVATALASRFIVIFVGLTFDPGLVSGSCASGAEAWCTRDSAEKRVGRRRTVQRIHRASDGFFFWRFSDCTQSRCIPSLVSGGLGMHDQGVVVALVHCLTG